VRTSVRDSQGSVYGRFRRALDGGNPTIALAAAADLQHVGLADAPGWAARFSGATCDNARHLLSAGSEALAPFYEAFTEGRENLGGVLGLALPAAR
jgi:hypothetical protein